MAYYCGDCGKMFNYDGNCSCPPMEEQDPYAPLLCCQEPRGTECRGRHCSCDICMGEYGPHEKEEEEEIEA